MKRYEGYCQYADVRECVKCGEDAYIEIYETDEDNRNKVTGLILCCKCLENVGRSDIEVQ